MTLYFLRHGKAVPREDPKFPKDFDRPLTKQGIKEMLNEAEAMLHLNILPEIILTSTLVRARQTAEIIADMLELKKGLYDVPDIGGGFDFRKLNATLKEYSSFDKIMFVGHEPDFSELISQLIGGGRIVMKKGGLARVDFTNNVARGRGDLVWLLAPRVLLAIGER